MTVSFELDGQVFLGVSWQIVPERFNELVGDPDPARAQRAIQAMFGMKKRDIAALEQAADGVSV